LSIQFHTQQKWGLHAVFAAQTQIKTKASIDTIVISSGSAIRERQKT